jgi:DNA-binding response OmpR family regulator
VNAESLPRVLVADDDPAMGALLREYLEHHGFSVTVVYDGDAAASVGARGEHDLVVLDVMLPRRDGLAALREIRRSSPVPVIILSGRVDEIDRVLGLELGADDYVAKPCTPREFLARVRAVLRRVTPQHEVYRAGALVIAPAGHLAEWRGRPLGLTLTEFNLLAILARHAGRVVSKKQLSELALGRPLMPFDRAIDAHVSAIRAKLGDGASLIHTVRGVGYQLARE